MKYGRLLSYTTLYVTPEGFPPELTLCLVDNGREVVLAYGEWDGAPQLDTIIEVREKAGMHYVRTLPTWKKIIPWLSLWLARPATR